MVGKLKPQLICIFAVVFFLSVLSVNVSGIDYQSAVPPEDKTASTVWLSKIKQSGQNYWAKLRETLGRGHSYFFPPNIDFRGENDEHVEMGAGEKVKEAAAKSFEKSKETVEEAARSAAEIATDTAEIVKEKVMQSVSGRESQQLWEGTGEL